MGPFFDPNDFTSGLPSLRTKPNAKLVLYMDFDGGRYKDEDPDLSPYYTGSPTQGRNIVRSFNFMMQYFAMFDIALTTRAADVGTDSNAAAWGWIVISPDISGGRASVGVIDRRENYPRARSSESTIDGSDRSRRLAHEFGHNFGLKHNGAYEGEEFFKFEDWDDWDGEFGSVMGGGGEGDRNGWATAVYDQEEPPTVEKTQDSMEVIRQAVVAADADTPNSGWAIDDFPDTAPLCAGNELYRVGVIGHPGDVDTFAFSWPGGDIEIEAFATETSAAELQLSIARDGMTVGTDSVVDAPAGVYEVSVESVGSLEVMKTQDVGSYEAMGYYELYLR